MGYYSQAYNLTREWEWCPYGSESITQSCEWQTNCWQNIELFSDPSDKENSWWEYDPTGPAAILVAVAPSPENQPFGKQNDLQRARKKSIKRLFLHTRKSFLFGYISSGRRCLWSEERCTSSLPDC